MPVKEWFREWFNSPYYHKLYFERDEKEATAFINNLIGHLQPPPGSWMLDVACGRGRHSKILASMGFTVTGIDISPDSIAFAKQFQSENLDFFIHDIRLPFWGNFFDYAFNFFTSFGYFKTRREHENAFRSIANSLKPGGLFIIDYLNKHFAEDHLVPQEAKKINGTMYDILRWQDEKHFFKKITISDPSLQQPVTFTEEVVKFSLGDFTELLAFNGMQVKEVFGNYQFDPYDINKTPRLIIITEKQKVESTTGKKALYGDGRKTEI